MIKDERIPLTVLQKANIAFKAGEYETAIDLYQQVAAKVPPLATSLKVNIALAQAKLADAGTKPKAQLAAVQTEPATTIPKPELVLKNTVADADSLAVAVNLQPLDNNSWQSTNDDPHFYLDMADKVLAAGFYQLALQLNTEKALSKASAKLYCDYGNGFNEQDTIVFCVPFNKAASRVVWLDQPVKALRFDPLEVALEFKLEAFELTAVCETSALAYMENSLLDKNIVLPESADDYQHNLYQLYDCMINSGLNSTSYEEWIQLKELPSLPDNGTVAQHITGFTHKPVFSVVMPTYNTDEVYLRECIDSVLSQSYPYLELCIADDNSPKPHVLKVLNEYAAKDTRVKVVARKQNGHISRATNSAIEVATGDFIALLDHDDLLAQHALYFMAEAINAKPDGQIFYSDEDKIDLQGRRTNPHFKSDWNPDLFFSQNYVSHLGVYKASLIKKIGGFRTGVEGSQDQDLLLRCLPHVKHNQIHHIPRVLYHWRMLEGSTALASGEKSYTTAAGIKALQDYFTENGPEGVKVEAGLVPNTYKVNWPVPTKAPKVSLLIPTRDRKTITEVAVRSILEKTTYPNYEIVILDNGSVEPETLSFFKQIQQEDKRVSVLRYDYPFNYSAINNYGVKHTNGELVGLINNDIEVINPQWLTEMVSHAIRQDIGCVGAKLYYSNGQIQHAGVILGIGGVAGHSHKYFDRNAHGFFSRLKLTQNLSAVTAAVLIIRRDTYNQVNGLNENDLKVAFNDVDFCLKVRKAGYRNLWTPYAELYHHESISRGHEDTPEKQARFKVEVDYMKNTWPDALERDPYYSPNLTKDREDFSIGLN